VDASSSFGEEQTGCFLIGDQSVDEAAPKRGEDGWGFRGAAGDCHDVWYGPQLLEADGDEAAREAGDLKLSTACVQDGRAHVGDATRRVELAGKPLG
jgi:hypothetical protein